MSCLDCWEWFVEFVIRCEQGDGPYILEKPPKEKPKNSGEAPTESLNDNDIEFRRDRMRQLFNKHGFNLAIYPGGQVRGEKIKVMFHM